MFDRVIAARICQYWPDLYAGPHKTAAGSWTPQDHTRITYNSSTTTLPDIYGHRRARYTPICIYVYTMNDQTSGTIGPVINKRTEYTVLTIGVDQGHSGAVLSSLRRRFGARRVWPRETYRVLFE